MKTMNNRIPEFKTLEEEREYWEARGPLAKGRKGTVNKPKTRQKRSSFLAVRLTGEELTQIRDIAAKQGLGPSTFARIVLTSAIERQSQPDMVTLTELKNMMESFLSQPTMDKGEGYSKKDGLTAPSFMVPPIFSSHPQPSPPRSGKPA